MPNHRRPRRSPAPNRCTARQRWRTRKVDVIRGALLAGRPSVICSDNDGVRQAFVSTAANTAYSAADQRFLWRVE